MLRRTIQGSKFKPDLTLGGLTGKPAPNYKGAGIEYSAPEVYGRVYDTLVEPYDQPPNGGEIFRGIAQTLTEEEAELWLYFPDFSYLPEDPAPQTIAEVARRVRPELAARIDELAASLIAKEFIIEMDQQGGTPRYMRSYLLFLLSSYAGREDSPLCDALFHWFYNIIRGDSANLAPTPLSGDIMIAMPNEVALTGNEALGKVPMNLQIPDNRMVIDFDRTSQIIENARTLALGECTCRAATEREHDRACDHPMETCILIDEDAEIMLKLGYAEPKTKEEIHQLLRECRDLGLVQMAYDAEHPTSICNCCKCCCIFLNSLARGETTIGGVSRFIPQRLDGCRNCGQCAAICPMETITMTEQGASINLNKCIGCGLCVTKCNFGALKLTLRDPQDTSTNRACVHQKRAGL